MNYNNRKYYAYKVNFISLNFEKFNDVNELQPLNIKFIS